MTTAVVGTGNMDSIRAHSSQLTLSTRSLIVRGLATNCRRLVRIYC
jgi:hypothetical protein